MAFVKYSMGGPITSVEDKDSVEKREEVVPEIVEAQTLILCKQCGIQHAILKAGPKRVCCGNVISADSVS